MTAASRPDLAGAEDHALRQVKAYGYEWGVLSSGEVIPFYVVAPNNSPHPPFNDPNDMWGATQTHPDWMECYVVFETWQVA